jgi:23S rRNA (uracil1939-C5)-methyltransferase
MLEQEVTIHDVAFGGAGVGRLADGKVVFVPFTLPGEVVRVRLIKTRKDFSQGELIEVLKPSPARVPAPCVYFAQCGGCQYQHINYSDQLRMKEKQIRDTLERIGKFKTVPPIAIESSDESYGYRNKITVHRGQNDDIGFYAPDSRTVIDIEKCIISTESVNAKLAELREKRFVPEHVTLTDSSERSGSPEGSFHQVNSKMAEKLLYWVRGHINPRARSQLFDLYCGSGFFAFGLSDLFPKVTGLERDQKAIHLATQRAAQIKAPHVQFFATDVESHIDWLLKDLSMESTTVLLDPPRDGLPKTVVSSLAKAKPASLIYISCNPATLSRDLKLLMEIQPETYSFQALGFFDMFPQTAHIELVAVLDTIK